MMLSFQSPHKFLIICIAICITHFAFTEAFKATCTHAYFMNDGTTGVCAETEERVWRCPTKQCSFNNRQYAPMNGCTLDKTPGASSQQCTGYQMLKSGRYECYNFGDVRYTCPKAGNTEVMTCSQCKA